MAARFNVFEVDEEEGALSRSDIDAIRKGESSMTDVDAAEALTDRVAALMTTVATGGPAIRDVNDDYQREHRALAAVLRRLGIEYPNRLDDLWRWYGRWSDGSMPRYKDRRLYIADLFSPVRQALAERQDAGRELVEGVTEGATGWSKIDRKMARLRRLFREAEDADGYNVVGLQCVSILTSLGRVVFDPQRDLRSGEQEPGRDDAKARIRYFLRRAAPGDRFEDLRKITNAAYSQANTAKHRDSATRLDAGLAANATVLLVSTLRLLADEEEAKYEAWLLDQDVPDDTPPFEEVPLDLDDEAWA